MSIISGFLKWQRKLYWNGVHVLLSQWCQDEMVVFEDGINLYQLLGNNPLPVPTVSQSMKNLIINYRARCNELIAHLLAEPSDLQLSSEDSIVGLIKKIHVYKRQGYSSESDVTNSPYSDKVRSVQVANSSSGDNFSTIININGLYEYTGKKGVILSDLEQYAYISAKFPYKCRITKITGSINSGAKIVFDFKAISTLKRAVYSSSYVRYSFDLNTINPNEFFEIITTNDLIFNFIKVSIEGQQDDLILDIDLSWDGFQIVTPKKGTIK